MDAAAPGPMLVPAPGLVRRGDAGASAAEDLAAAVELLRGVASGVIAHERVLRISRPAPALAMTRRESRMPGFAVASAAAVRAGFDPVVRPTGGRAVAYDPSCVVFDLVCREEGEIDPSGFFARAGGTIAATLRGLGVDARVGEVPGEYCPGEYSINARGRVKLVGTSQRAMRGARLLSGMLAFGDVARLRAVLVEANAALELAWDPETFASMRDEAPAVTREAFEDALAAAFVSSGV